MDIRAHLSRTAEGWGTGSEAIEVDHSRVGLGFGDSRRTAAEHTGLAGRVGSHLAEVGRSRLVAGSSDCSSGCCRRLAPEEHRSRFAGAVVENTHRSRLAVAVDIGPEVGSRHIAGLVEDNHRTGCMGRTCWVMWM